MIVTFLGGFLRIKYFVLGGVCITWLLKLDQAIPWSTYDSLRLRWPIEWGQKEARRVTQQDSKQQQMDQIAEAQGKGPQL